MGAAGTATVDFGTGVGVTQDATKKWWFPDSDKEWTRLLNGTAERLGRSANIVNPKRFWKCQDAATPIVEANGTGDNFTFQSGSATFQSVTSGFSRLGVKPTSTDANWGATIGADLASDAFGRTKPFFFLQVRHINTLSGAGFRGLGGFSGSTIHKFFYDQIDGRLGATYSGGGGIFTGKALTTDLIVGFLMESQLVGQRERYKVLNNQQRDNLYPPDGIGAIFDLSGSVAVTAIGDPQAILSTDDATLMYAALWAGASLIRDPLSMNDAYEIIRLIQEGPDDPFPGSNRTSVTVTGQAGITTTSHVEAWIQGNDSTADHNAYEHSMVPITVRPENIVNGTGFDIVATSDLRLTGQFKVHWVWN